MEDSNNELSIIKNRLEKNGKVSFVPKATEDQISEFETKNNITLPLKYKEWLLFSDGGELFLPAGIQLYGVLHNPLIDINDNDKPSDNYTVIGAFADGRPILFEKNSERILIYNHETGVIDEDDTFYDFFDFLNNIDSKLS